MTCQISEVGSVTFQPGHSLDVYVSVWRGPWTSKEGIVDGFRVWGFCTVVVKRSMSVVTTRVEPAIECCNAMQPVKWHFDQVHNDLGDAAHGDWSYKLEYDPL